jgi:hypothetical protein
MRRENFQNPFTFCLLVATCCTNMAQNTQNTEIWQIWVIFSQKILFSRFQKCENFPKEDTLFGIVGGCI